MSKKSRRRNKRLIMLALAGGAAAMAAKRKKSSIEGMDDAGINVTHSALTDTAPVVNKAVVADAAADSAGTSPHIFDTRFSKPGQETMSKAERSQNLAANAAKNAAMNYQRSQTFDARPRPTAIQTKGRNFSYKKGGRVTGIAKRGFGRALMKGKK